MYGCHAPMSGSTAMQRAFLVFTMLLAALGFTSSGVGREATQSEPCDTLTCGLPPWANIGPADRGTKAKADRETKAETDRETKAENRVRKTLADNDPVLSEPAWSAWRARFCAMRDEEARTVERNTGAVRDRPGGEGDGEKCQAYVRRHHAALRQWIIEEQRIEFQEKWSAYCGAIGPKESLWGYCEMLRAYWGTSTKRKRREPPPKRFDPEANSLAILL